MKLAIKIFLFLTVVPAGAGLALYGWGSMELKLANKATPEPIAVDLAKLEAGEPLASIHITVGPHYALYDSSVYSSSNGIEGESLNYSKGKLGAGNDVDCVFYPIVSKGNANIKDLEDLKKKYGGLDKIPQGDLPTPTHFTVLVRTRRFVKVRDIPDDAFKEETSVQGLVVNEVGSFDAEQAKLIQAEFPAIDFKNVLILEQHRKPTSPGTAVSAVVGGYTMLGLGFLSFVGVVVLGVTALFGGRKSSSAITSPQ
jgi:hypothetical protein